MPSIILTQRRAYSSDIIIDPIDSRFLFSPAANANFLVSVNNMLSTCQFGCEYTFLDSYKISALSLSGSTLTFTLIHPLSLALDLTRVSVTLNNKVCFGLSGSINSLTCNLP